MGYSKIERNTDNDERVRTWSRDMREMWKYLLNNSHMGAHGSRIGCYVLDPMYAAADLTCTDWEPTRAHVLAQLEALHQEERIVWDPRTRLVLIRRYFRFNEPANPNVAKRCAADIDALPFSETILKGLLEAVRTLLPATFAGGKPCGDVIAEAITARLEKSSNSAKSNPSETLSEPFGKPFPKQGQVQGQVQNGNTSASHSGPAPAMENVDPDGDEHSNGDSATHATLAPLIRKHFWKGPKPPPATERGWTMGRELQLAKQLMARCRADLDEFAAVIEHSRMVLGFKTDDPMTLKIFNVKSQGDALEEVLGYVRKQAEQRAAEAGLKGLDQFLVGGAATLPAVERRG